MFFVHACVEKCPNNISNQFGYIQLFVLTLNNSNRKTHTEVDDQRPMCKKGGEILSSAEKWYPYAMRHTGVTNYCHDRPDFMSIGRSMKHKSRNE